MSVWKDVHSSLMGWRCMAVLLVLLLAPWAMAALAPANQLLTSSSASSGVLGVTIQWQPLAPSKKLTPDSRNNERNNKPEGIAETARPVTKQADLQKNDHLQIQEATEQTTAAIPETSKAETAQIELEQREKKQLETQESDVQGSDVQDSVPALASSALGAHQHIEISQPLFAEPPAPPHYPGQARRRGQQGTVWLDVWLDNQGQHERIEVAKSSGIEVLDQSALNAVSNWRFLPYQQASVAMASRVRVPVRFQLQD